MQRPLAGPALLGLPVPPPWVSPEPRAVLSTPFKGDGVGEVVGGVSLLCLRKLQQVPLGLLQAMLQLLPARPLRLREVHHPGAGRSGIPAPLAPFRLTSPPLLPPTVGGRHCLAHPAPCVCVCVCVCVVDTIIEGSPLGSAVA